VAVVQAPLTAGCTEMLVAETAPVLPACPRAVTHVPTVTAAAVAFCWTAYAVAPLVVTLTLVGVAVLVALGMPGRVEAMTKPVPETDVTMPEVPPKPPRPMPGPPGAPSGAPVGGVPPGAVPTGAPLGGTPSGAPEGRTPPPGAPPGPALHDPSTGCVRVTLVAATWVGCAGAPGCAVGVGAAVPAVTVEALRTVTQLPTFTSASVAATCAVKVVLAVHVTAVWASLDCTWAVDPATSATRPLAPGRRC
jgi:hypothetical protein